MEKLSLPICLSHQFIKDSIWSLEDSKISYTDHLREGQDKRVNSLILYLDNVWGAGEGGIARMRMS